MKLKKLYIKNLASIAEATIDFESQPLASESLFLITGETGAGKTTILDALCLALYNATPRLKNRSTVSYTNIVRNRDNEEKTISIGDRDVRQLLRRNTTEGCVKLDFEGNDGIWYTSLWTIGRTRYGNLRNVELSLENHHTNEIINGIENTVNTIFDVIGLDLSQFTRTVMLPQGGFAEFLKSNATEKTAILEKITRTEQFANVGMSIYEIFKEHTQAWEQAKALLDGIELLTPEQRENLLSEITQNTELRAALQQQFQEKQAQITLLQQLRENETRRNDLERRFNESKAETETEAYRNESQTETQWLATTAIRGRLAEGVAAEREHQNLLSREGELQQRRNTLTAELSALEQHIEQDSARQERLAQWLAEHERHTTMYNNRETLLRDINALNKQERDIADTQQKLEVDKEKVPVAELKKTETLHALQQAEDQLEQSKDGIAGKEAEIDALNLPQLRQQREDILTRIGICNRTQSDLELLNERHRLVKEAEQNLKSSEQTLESQRASLPALQQAATDAQAAFEQAKHRFELAQARVNDWAVEMRQLLQQGDSCPVCGHIIDSVFREERTQSLLEDERMQMADCQQKLTEALAKLQTANNEVARLENEIPQQRHIREQRSDERQQQLNIVMNAFANINIEYSPEHAAERLNAHIDSLNQQRNPLNEQIQQGEAMESAVTDLREKHHKLESACENARRKDAEAQKNLDELNNAINTQTELLNTLTAGKAKRTSDITAMISDATWAGQWTENRQAFTQWLDNQVQQYNTSRTDKQQIDNRLQSHRTILTSMREASNRLATLRPEWEPADGGITTMPPSTALQQWNLLVTDVTQWLDNVSRTATTATECRQLVDEFVDNNDITRERLLQLNGIPDTVVKQIHNRHQLKDRELAELTGQLQANENQRAQLDEQNTSHLTLADEERLNDERQNIDNRLQEVDARNGAINAELTADDRNRERVSDIQQKVEQLENEKRRWQELNNEFGDPNGNKFRKIAQGMILDDLVQRANHFLRYFAPRFQLTCEADSLLILVSDSGAQPASTATLSGGETFMVSLALALALSQTVGNDLNVDTLFIDEGFGTLSNDCLDSVMDTLSRLHDRSGRRVGIISHVESLKECIPTHIQVARDSKDNTCSTVTVMDTTSTTSTHPYHQNN